MRVRSAIPLACLVLAAATGKARCETAAGDGAILAVVSGGGRVLAIADGFIVYKDGGGSIRWTRSSDGYFASGNGESLRLTRAYDGFILYGGRGGRVAVTSDGFIVRPDRGQSERWTKSSDGFYGSINGQSARLSATRDGYLCSMASTNRVMYPAAKPKKVKRMSKSRPSAFNR